MKKTQLVLAIVVATTFAIAPFAAEAKHKKHHQSTTSQTTGSSANPSSQGNVGPGTNQAGSMTK